MNARELARTGALTLLAMLAFAGNSLLCRLALRNTGMDPVSFTCLRLAAGAVILNLIANTLRRDRSGGGNWRSAFALYAYAGAFSFAYVSLPAASGALLLFGAVQATMIGHGLAHGERLTRRQWLGLACAGGGVVVLILPGMAAPPLLGSAAMIAAGIAWGIYSLRGKGGGDPTRVTAGNFLRATPLALAVALPLADPATISPAGLAYALASGALASGLGYALWYAVLPRHTATTAASVQLSVPALTAFGGVLLLDEALGLRIVLASLAILGGIVLVIRGRHA